MPEDNRLNHNPNTPEDQIDSTNRNLSQTIKRS